jgi:hypothetical protein
MSAAFRLKPGEDKRAAQAHEEGSIPDQLIRNQRDIDMRREPLQGKSEIIDPERHRLEGRIPIRKEEVCFFCRSKFCSFDSAPLYAY